MLMDVIHIQYAPGNPSEVLVTSADSQIRVFDGVTMVQKFRGTVLHLLVRTN